MRTDTHSAYGKKAFSAIWNNAVFEGLLPGQRESRWGSKQDRRSQKQGKNQVSLDRPIQGD